ncbi:unnamed protein product, partial [Mycena citricolor]
GGTLSLRFCGTKLIHRHLLSDVYLDAAVCRATQTPLLLVWWISGSGMVLHNRRTLESPSSSPSLFDIGSMIAAGLALLSGCAALTAVLSNARQPRCTGCVRSRRTRRRSDRVPTTQVARELQNL